MKRGLVISLTYDQALFLVKVFGTVGFDKMDSKIQGLALKIPKRIWDAAGVSYPELSPLVTVAIP